MAKTDTIMIAVLGFEGCSSWITAGLLELFAIANNARATLPPATRGRRSIEFCCHLVARSARGARGSHGVKFAVHPPRRRYDALIVPPIWCESLADLQQRAHKLHSERSFLQQMARRSKIVASACSGAVLLADAGLLTKRRATTCWWLVEWLGRTFPQIEIVGDRLVMRDGNRWTAAAGTAYMHLALEIVRELGGEEIAAATARLMLVERRRGSQSPFLPGPTPAARQTETEIDRVMRYLAQRSIKKLTVADACRALSISERTLARKVRAAVGMSPLGYLQSQRVARARQLLEASSLSLERIVEECGYQDVSSFRKLFARQVGMTPREYRSRFSLEVAGDQYERSG